MAQPRFVQRLSEADVPLDSILLDPNNPRLIGLDGGGMAADRCGFCGSLDGPFTAVEGVFTVLMCPACLAARARGRGPYPGLTDAEMRAGLDLMPTWALEQKAAAFSGLKALQTFGWASPRWFTCHGPRELCV
jgi:hypothetical protein